MKTVCKKLLSLMLVAILLVSAVPFQASAAEGSSEPSPNVTVNVKVNGGANGSNTTTLVLTETPQTLDTALAAQMYAQISNSGATVTGAVWTNNSGTNVTGGTIAFNDWYKSQTNYSLNLDVSVTYPAPTPDPEPTYNITLRYVEAGNTANVLFEKNLTGLTTGTVIDATEHYTPNGYSFGTNTTRTVGTTSGVMQFELTKNPVPANFTVSYSILGSQSKTKTITGYNVGDDVTLNADLIGESYSSFGANPVMSWSDGTNTYSYGATITVRNGMNLTFTVTNNNTAKITLNANGGSVSSSYVYGVKGSAYPVLPTPTREGYDFEYWYYTDNTGKEVRIYSGSANQTVTGDITLKAKWVGDTITVTFQKYTNDGWVNVCQQNVVAGSTVSKPTGDFSYSCNGVNFNIVGWEIGESDVAFNFDSTQVTRAIVVRPRYQGTVTLCAQEPETRASWKSNYVTLEIGEPIGTLSNPGSRSTYAFGGWVASNGTTPICNSYCKSSLEYYPGLYGTTFYVKWDNAITVNLHIHTGGNTANATKIVPYYVAPAEGAFDLSAINMYSIYPAYANYDDEGDVHYGWYSTEEWTKFCANRAAHSAYIYTNIEKNGLTDFHIMLIDNGNNTTYNTNSSTLDSSNPTTGDQIFMAVTVLAVSASALALMLYFNKKHKAST